MVSIGEIIMSDLIDESDPLVLVPSGKYRWTHRQELPPKKKT